MSLIIKNLVRFIRLIIYALQVQVRTVFYTLIFSSFGKGSQIFGRITVTRPENIKIGKHSTLNDGVYLGGPGGIEVGNNVHISPHVIINSGSLNTHNFQRKEHIGKKVIIKDHAWIASGAIINPGVTIGESAIVASGATVTKDVQSFTVVAGTPAKPIKKVQH